MSDGAAGKTAVITGGAGGLGRALADALKADGWHCALIDLPGDALNNAAKDDPAVTAYPCDVTDAGAVAEVCRQITADRPSVDLVIYAAGITHIGLFAESDPTVHQRVMDINYMGTVHVVAGLLEPVRAAKGTHLALSSVAGFAPLIKRTAYAASKHAVEGFFKTLRSEEKPYGVKVLIAAPSFVATNVGADDAKDGTARPGSAKDSLDIMSADEAARIILSGYKKGRAFIPVGRVARLSYWLCRLFPGLYTRLMERRIRP